MNQDVLIPTQEELSILRALRVINNNEQTEESFRELAAFTTHLPLPLSFPLINLSGIIRANHILPNICTDVKVEAAGEHYHCVTGLIYPYWRIIGFSDHNADTGEVCIQLSDTFSVMPYQKFLTANGILTFITHTLSDKTNKSKRDLLERFEYYVRYARNTSNEDKQILTEHIARFKANPAAPYTINYVNPYFR